MYLLDVLLEHAQLQPLVQPDLPVLPDILEAPLVVQDLVHDIQDAVNLQKHSDVTAGTIQLLEGEQRTSERRSPLWSNWQWLSAIPSCQD